MKWLENNPIWVILFAVLTVYVIHLDLIPVSIMEARNFITAREMVTDGNWLLTTMNQLPRYEKPPLPSWITAFFGGIFGINHLAVLRLPTMLMAFVLGFGAYRLSLEMLQNRRHALLNALIVLSSFYVIVITIEAPWDIYTHAFMLMGIYFLYRFLTSPKGIWSYALGAGLCVGLSFMSKGPISLYALLLPFLFSFGIVYGYKGRVVQQKRLPLVCMLLLATITSMWWFLYVRMADPQAFIAITEKETANWSSYNVRPFYYYWSFIVQSGIWTIPALMGLMYPYLKTRVRHPKEYLFTLLWTVFSLVLLSVIPEKKTRYLVPVLIPLALNTGFYVAFVIQNFNKDMAAKERVPVYLHFILWSTVCLAFPLVAYLVLKNGLDGYWGYYVLASISLCILGIVMLIHVRKKQLFKAFLLTIGLVALLKLTALPLIGALEKNTDYQNISELAASDFAKQTAIYAFGEIAPEMIWNYGTWLPVLKGVEEITIPEGDVFGILVVPSEENEFKRIFDPEYTYHLKTVYDLNYNTHPGTKGHKNRLVSYLYTVKKR
ncbi:glycosyltransferase family 39 protein [Arenibacter sp. GZD96]|uniref:ArnT family glycosyltransferase n=1 Tax=Aurantibrevibacter litoralis TaxID=3106030 RepID=UPI002AFF13AB|nr:glycosyltransferase family 39 protein [Arenibacter sp. GZD-96]MEA1785038.1 glycosyltransferase family 39 protein [Arenibacter sp. GZD-96]